MIATMRILLAAATALFLAASATAEEPATREADPVVGRYYAQLGPDALSALRINPDGTFDYALSAGALDERASGRWMRHGDMLRFTTEPHPVAPLFVALAPLQATGPLSVSVTWPDGQGIAGIDVTVGFDSGEPATGYTQEDGWTLPADESRMPRWIRLDEPVHGIVSPEFRIDPAAGNALVFKLEPNDLGMFDFRDAPVEIDGDELLVHRGEGRIRYLRRPR
ncbi:hypothetical protein FHS96_000728 [Sphingomonas zeicaulis]|uniref:hypothetical protein n=1 Tax=Sphingomonas zeicaulis TaxID=1632740 RepID=UPI003D1C4F56